VRFLTTFNDQFVANSLAKNERILENGQYLMKLSSLAACSSCTASKISQVGDHKWSSQKKIN